MVSDRTEQAWREFVSLGEFERAAQDAWTPGARDVITEGAGENRAVRANRIGWERWALRQRVLVDVSRIDTSTTVLGTEISAPILFAPSGLHEMSHPDAELATARAATDVRSVMVLSSACSRPMAEIRAAAGDGTTWFQLFWGPDRAAVRDVVRMAESEGCTALVLTVDMSATPLVGPAMRSGIESIAHLSPMYTAARVTRPGADVTPPHDPRLTWADLRWLREQTSLPLVLKGILTAEDAALAVEHGVDAVIVSNHGGRVLDTARATADVLPEVAEAVGEEIDVYVDGGIRRGHDVAVALALGARAVLIGRPVTWGLAVGGDAGVRAAYDVLHAELSNTMALIGAPSLDDIRRNHLAPATR